MMGPDLTPESVKRRFDDETINKAKTFRTLGVGRQAALNYLDTPQGTRYLEQLPVWKSSPPAPTRDGRGRSDLRVRLRDPAFFSR